MSDSSVLIAQAVEADRSRNYETALVMYQIAIDILLTDLRDLKNSPFTSQKKLLKYQIKALLERAEQIKVHMKKTSEKKKEKQEWLALTRTNSHVSYCTLTSPDNHKEDVRERKGQRLPERYPQSSDFQHNRSDNIEKEREWAFRFDLNFDMKGKIRTPTVLPMESAERDEIGPGVVASVMNLFRLLR